MKLQSIDDGDEDADRMIRLDMLVKRMWDQYQPMLVDGFEDHPAMRLNYYALRYQ